MDNRNGPPLIVKTPFPLALRLVFSAIGLFAICTPVWGLHRGVWPPSLMSAFFLVIILGAWTIGWPALIGALTGWASVWSIERGSIRIVERNPFGFRRRRLDPDDVDRIEVVPRPAMEGDETYVVRFVTRSGRAFDTREFQKRAAAEKLRQEISETFGRPL